MKKIYILASLFLLISLFGTAKPLSKESVEAKVKNAKQCLELSQQLHQHRSNASPLKSVQAKSKMLEEITLADGGKKEFFYDEKGNTIGYKNYKFNEETGALVLSEDNTFSYDGKGNRTLQVFKSLIDNEMVVVEKDEYEYDSQNREILHIFWEFSNDSGTLVKNSKTVTSYQSDLIKMEEYSWNEASQNWMLEAKTEIEYKNDRIVKGTYYTKDEETGEVTKSMISELTYNSDGTLKMTLLKAVDAETGQMADFMKSEMTYDSNGNEILSVESMFEPESATWMLWSQTKSVYSSNVLIADEYYALNWTTFQLSITEKHEYTYTNGKLTQELVKEDTDLDGELSETYKYEFAYDNSININDVVLPDSWIEHKDVTDIWGGFQFTYGALSNVKWYEWNYEISALKQYRDATYHYSKFGSNVAVTSFDASNIKVGPNPFAETISVSFTEATPATLSVYNVSGQKVFSAMVKENTTINTSLWEKGMYMVRLTTRNGRHEVAKLVKR